MSVPQAPRRVRVRRRVLQRLAIVGALAVAGVVAHPAGPAAASPLGVERIAENSGKCLDVTGVSTADGAPIQQWDCLGTANQRVTIESVGSGSSWYRLRFAHSGKCLDVTNASTADGALIQQWTCLPGQHNQHFRYEWVHGNHYKFVAEHSGKCLDIVLASRANGARLQQWTCRVSTNQHFL